MHILLIKWNDWPAPLDTSCLSALYTSACMPQPFASELNIYLSPSDTEASSLSFVTIHAWMPFLLTGDACCQQTLWTFWLPVYKPAITWHAYQLAKTMTINTRKSKYEKCRIYRAEKYLKHSVHLEAGVQHEAQTRTDLLQKQCKTVTMLHKTGLNNWDT